jgi:UDP-3-O-[3-hydroxymyristoyl] N-acetylglucosamine deacetylase
MLYGMRYTVAEAVKVRGVGLHSGAPCVVEVRPAPVGTGWRLNGTPVAEARRLDAAYATRLQTAQGPVATVEHLLAALVIGGIDDVALWVEGGEVPGLDGSAAPWLAAWAPRAHGGARQPVRLAGPVEVRDGARWLRAEPAPTLRLEVTVEHPPIAPWRCVISDLRTVAHARTYGFLHDAPRLRAAGLALGSDWANTAVLGPDGACLNPEGFRCADEPARHKALDLLGDLALLGRPIQARIIANRPGHALNHRLLEAIQAGQR